MRLHVADWPKANLRGASLTLAGAFCGRQAVASQIVFGRCTKRSRRVAFAVPLRQSD